MTAELITRRQALLHSPALHKVLLVLAVDLTVSAGLLVWERVDRFQHRHDFT